MRSYSRKAKKSPDSRNPALAPISTPPSCGKHGAARQEGGAEREEGFPREGTAAAGRGGGGGERTSLSFLPAHPTHVEMTRPQIAVDRERERLSLVLLPSLFPSEPLSVQPPPIIRRHAQVKASAVPRPALNRQSSCHRASTTPPSQLLPRRLSVRSVLRPAFKLWKRIRA